METSRLVAIWEMIADLQHVAPDPADDPAALRQQVERTADAVARIYGEAAVEQARTIEASAGTSFAKLVRVEIERRGRLATR